MRVIAWDILFLFLFAANLGASSAIDHYPMASIDLRFLVTLLPFTLGLLSTPSHGYRTSSSKYTCGEADIAVVVDTTRYSDTVRTFLADVTKELSTIGDMRFGVVVFSNHANAAVRLNGYNDMNDLQYKIRRISFTGGSARIADGLQTARTVLSHNQVRSGAFKIIILLTDGRSNERAYNVKRIAQYARYQGIRVIPVGISSWANLNLLGSIANYKKDVIPNLNLKTLKSEVGDVVSLSCSPPVTAEDCSIVDIVFLVDASGSIGSYHWGLVRNFIRDTINGLAKMSWSVRFAAVTFNGQAKVVFDLNDYTNANSAAYRVSRMSYDEGATNIADAFRVAREIVFPTGRPPATKLVILLTDGKPNVNTSSTELEAQRVKNLGAHVVSIGVTNNIDKAQIRRISTTYRDALYSLNFNQLHSRVSNLVTTSCPKSTAGVDCNKADVALVVDSSGSIGTRDWNLALQFLEKIIRDIMAGHDVRFGLVDFSSSAHVVFNFNGYQTVNSVVHNTKNMRYYGGWTNIADALKEAKVRLFNYKRPGAVGIAILLTDGKPNVRTLRTVPEAYDLKNMGVHIIPVGVTSYIDVNLLRKIANNPHEVITTPSFALLSTQINNVIGEACGPTRYCKKSDVVLAVDSSGSIGSSDWNKLLLVLQDIITTIHTEGEDVHFGLVEFGSSGKLILNLKPRTLSQVTSTARSMKHLEGGTNMSAGLKIARTQIFPTSTRPTAAKMLILISDGHPNNKRVALQHAKYLKAAGIRVITIGVTKSIDSALLKKMASTPRDAFTTPNFKSLSHEIRKVIRALCHGGSINLIH